MRQINPDITGSAVTPAPSRRSAGRAGLTVESRRVVGLSQLCQIPGCGGAPGPAFPGGLPDRRSGRLYGAIQFRSFRSPQEFEQVQFIYPPLFQPTRSRRLARMLNQYGLKPVRTINYNSVPSPTICGPINHLPTILLSGKREGNEVVIEEKSIHTQETIPPEKGPARAV